MKWVSPFELGDDGDGVPTFGSNDALDITYSPQIPEPFAWFKVVLLNTGGQPATGLAVTDSRGAFPVDADCPPVPATLAAGDGWVCRYQVTFSAASAGSNENTVSATGANVVPDGDDSRTATVTVTACTGDDRTVPNLIEHDRARGASRVDGCGVHRNVDLHGVGTGELAGSHGVRLRAGGVGMTVSRMAGRGSRGQALAEFALVVPDPARSSCSRSSMSGDIVYTANTLSNSAREAARARIRRRPSDRMRRHAPRVVHPSASPGIDLGRFPGPSPRPSPASGSGSTGEHQRGVDSELSVGRPALGPHRGALHRLDARRRAVAQRRDRLGRYPSHREPMRSSRSRVRQLEALSEGRSWSSSSSRSSACSRSPAWPSRAARSVFNRRDAQNASDLAAVAGARMVSLHHIDGGRTGQDVFGAVRSSMTANDCAAAAPCTWTAQFVGTGLAPIGAVGNGGSIPGGALGVRIAVTRTPGAILGRMLGFTTWTVTTEATAIATKPSSVASGMVLPVAICGWTNETSNECAQAEDAPPNALEFRTRPDLRPDRRKERAGRFRMAIVGRIPVGQHLHAEQSDDDPGQPVRQP